MKKMYGLAATVVVLLHLGFIVFVVLGGLLVLRWPKLIWIHLPAAIWGALIEFRGWYCPLTGVEKWLLQAADKEVYSGGFIAHYIFAIIYPQGLTRGIEIALGVFVLMINSAVYAKVIRTALDQ